MQRRLFLKRLGLFGVAASVALPKIAMAGGMFNPMNSNLAGSLFYTMEAPGRWTGKEAGHVPMFERSGNMIEVTTGHEMDGYTHYIIKHVLLDENLDFVAETLFNPEADAPISTYDISGMKNSLYAVSLCNKHDAWVNRLQL
jgi:superoxide reductase